VLAGSVEFTVQIFQYPQHNSVGFTEILEVEYYSCNVIIIEASKYQEVRQQES